LDAIDRREVARLPGRSAVLSADGHWLATLSESGIIRVWELPPRYPWGALVLYAAGAALASLGVRLMLVRLVGTLRHPRDAALGRRVWSHRSRARLNEWPTG